MLQKHCKSNKSINYHDNSKLLAINDGGEKIYSLKIMQPGKNYIKDFDFIIAVIGRIANKSFYTKNLLGLEEKFIKDRLLYLAGDLKNNISRQVAFAISDGILAAMKLKEKLVESNC